jgi:MFS family permease
MSGKDMETTFSEHVRKPFGEFAFGWLRKAPPSARRALLAASLGWMLDSFDVMLYSMVLASLMRSLHMNAATAGILASVGLLAASLGGVVFGVLADRYGRVRALIASILIYAIFTGACGLATSVLELAVFRVFLGLGMGGEWASGAALVSETWPSEHRGKALGLMQSAWAIGYALAAIVTAVVMPIGGWRSVFFVGVLPAFVVLWIQRRVDEPAAWTEVRESSRPISRGIAQIFQAPLRRVTLAVMAMHSCCMFAWWGFNLWLPAFYSLPVASGGAGLSVGRMAILIVIMQAGMWLGYVTFGYISDAIGRKPAYVMYLLAAGALLIAFSGARSLWLLLALGPLVAFFGTGYYSGFGTVTAEIYDTRIRATAQGLTYNFGRTVSAAAPYMVGSFAQSHGFRHSFMLVAILFLLASVFWIWIPETMRRARSL